MRFPVLNLNTKLQIFVFSLLVAGTTMVLATNSTPAATAPQKPPVHNLPSVASKPLWMSLSAQQKLALAPLSAEWDNIDEVRKKKWLEIAAKYSSMKPDEQTRVQERIRDWVKLSPEQRMQARENFAQTTQIKPEQKSAQWQQYQQLSEDQKKQLANEINTKKSITNIPSESQRVVKPLAPIRVGPPAVTKPSPRPVPVPAAVVDTATTSEQAATQSTPVTTSTNNAAASQAATK
ncbi:DUF3106 domain-containing protein [Undibacterium sp. Ren11W]|uniref:DUF3106 domain-containing protein n=1 Tax=Undibacterium sp. Ren11W TaxID=3413045 RepID=UPI003BF1E2C6